MCKDIGNYRHDMDFETEVFSNVCWVPLNRLGKTRYTNEEMLDLSRLSPALKQQKIQSLYEAVQLFQVSEFKGMFDNLDQQLGGCHWQTHKSPLQAVETNEGCCASDTNWLSFFLNGKYDAIGSFGYGNDDGNGHIASYIRQDGYSYFIDMMMCRADSQPYGCAEDGQRASLLSREWGGFLFRCVNPLDFCAFYMESLRAKGRAVPYCFYIRQAAEVSATGCLKTGDTITFLVPRRDDPLLLWKDDSDRHRIAFVEPPPELRTAWAEY